MSCGRIWPKPDACPLVHGAHACSHGGMPAKAGMWPCHSVSKANPRKRDGWARVVTQALGTVGIATPTLPSCDGSEGDSRVLSPVPPTRVETLVPILQQVGSAVWGDHLRGHHVPAHLVGGPHRHRRGPLPPALRDLQEARYVSQAAPGGVWRALLSLRLPSWPACQLSQRACLRRCAPKGSLWPSSLIPPHRVRSPGECAHSEPTPLLLDHPLPDTQDLELPAQVQPPESGWPAGVCTRPGAA